MKKFLKKILLLLFLMKALMSINNAVVARCLQQWHLIWLKSVYQCVSEHQGEGGGEGGVFVAAVWFILFFLYLKHIFLKRFICLIVFLFHSGFWPNYIYVFFFYKTKKKSLLFWNIFFLKIYNTVSIFKVSLKKPVGNKTVILCVIPALVSESDLSKLKINLLLLLFFKELNLF